MPELPEVETVVRELMPLEGERIAKLEASWERTLDGGLEHFQERLLGARVDSVWRRGKYICLDLSSKCTLTIHLRMTGKCLFELGEKDSPYERVRLDFASGTQLHFVDVRKFGRWKIWAPDQLLPELGVEATSAAAVQEALTELNSRREIKKVLLDQRVLAGVGNIYADEALFMAGIHPTVPANRLKSQAIKDLAQAIAKVLQASIDNMGTTLSDYRNTRNIGGENQNYLQVYGQSGLNCLHCDQKIVKITLGGRGTHFCPRCQPEP